MVSQILSGAGRDPILDKTHRQKPGSSAAAFLKTRAQAGSGSYEGERHPRPCGHARIAAQAPR